MSSSDALDQEVGQVVATLPDGTEYRQVLLNPTEGQVHVTPDGRVWVAVREGVVDGSVIQTPFTIHWKGPGSAQVTVSFETRGVAQATIDSISRDLPEHPTIQQELNGTRNRLLYVELLDGDPEVKADEIAAPPSRFQAAFYDYTNNRVIRAIGNIADLTNLEVSEFSDQPVPTSVEFDAALARLAQEPDLGPFISENRVRTYRPMPPVGTDELPNGRVERTITVGLRPLARGNDAPNEIVGVNLIQDSVVRFPTGAPSLSLAEDQSCGIPDAGQPTTGRQFVPGQVWITVRQGSTVLWEFLAIRPAATKGPGLSTNGTGIELRFVDYRGKRVLYRAHVPILNVKYDPGGCGPFRDWQNEEGTLQANGVDVAPGFRLCNSPATTILDTGVDGGNYMGVAVYVQGQEVVLVSQMHAGWYRYVSEWRFGADGTIRPRFGFSAVNNSCVCHVHHHHVYWRFDFDIRTPGNNLVREFNDPCLPGFCPSNWHDKIFEIRRPRDPARKRRWRVENTVTGEAYEIVPGPNDGVASSEPDAPFPRGDVWILRYHANEIDDGVVATGPPYEAGIDAWLNFESIKGQDVVVWYGAHFTHNFPAEGPHDHGHILGPDLINVNW